MPEDNYEHAPTWNILKNVYVEELVITSKHLSLLLRLPVKVKVTSDEWEELRKLAFERQQYLQSLSTLVNEEILVKVSKKVA